MEVKNVNLHKRTISNPFIYSKWLSEKTTDIVYIKDLEGNIDYLKTWIDYPLDKKLQLKEKLLQQADPSSITAFKYLEDYINPNYIYHNYLQLSTILKVNGVMFYDKSLTINSTTKGDNLSLGTITSIIVLLQGLLKKYNLVFNIISIDNFLINKENYKRKSTICIQPMQVGFCFYYLILENMIMADLIDIFNILQDWLINPEIFTSLCNPLPKFLIQ